MHEGKTKKQKKKKLETHWEGIFDGESPYRKERKPSADLLLPAGSSGTCTSLPSFFVFLLFFSFRPRGKL